MPRMRALHRRTPGIPAAVLAGVVVSSLVSCAGASRPRASGPQGPAVAPWELPPGAVSSQSLFRFQYDGPEGEGTLRLVLRLEDPERYRLTVADRLGRPAVTVDAGAGGGYLVDHRESLACRLDAEVRIEEIPLDPLPLGAVPMVLLGRLPAPPRQGAEVSPGARRLSYRDSSGRRWTAELTGGSGAEDAPPTPHGEPVSWTLWRGDEPALWWRRTDGEMLLSNRDRGVQMRWREVGREALTGPLPPPEIPPGYAPGTCTPRAGPI